jgi:hypothetical protein
MASTSVRSYARLNRHSLDNELRDIQDRDLIAFAEVVGGIADHDLAEGAADGDLFSAGGEKLFSSFAVW